MEEETEMGKAFIIHMIFILVFFSLVLGDARAQPRDPRIAQLRSQFETMRRTITAIYTRKLQNIQADMDADLGWVAREEEATVMKMAKKIAAERLRKKIAAVEAAKTRSTVQLGEEKEKTKKLATEKSLTIKKNPTTKENPAGSTKPAKIKAAPH